MPSWADTTLHIDYMPFSTGEIYPMSGEIDIMKYYNNKPFIKHYTRIVATKDNLLGLIWLFKCKYL
jgi:hypothetical protein